MGNVVPPHVSCHFSRSQNKSGNQKRKGGMTSLTITCNDLLQIIAPILGTHTLLKEGLRPRRFCWIKNGHGYLSLSFAAKKPTQYSKQWPGSSQIKEEIISSPCCSTVRCVWGGNPLRLDLPPEEVVFEESMGVVWFHRMPGGEWQNQQRDWRYHGVPGLWGHSEGFGGEGWGGVLVQNGKEYGDQSWANTDRRMPYLVLQQWLN